MINKILSVWSFLLSLLVGFYALASLPFRGLTQFVQDGEMLSVLFIAVTLLICSFFIWRGHLWSRIVLLITSLPILFLAYMGTMMVSTYGQNEPKTFLISMFVFVVLILFSFKKGIDTWLHSEIK